MKRAVERLDQPADVVTARERQPLGRALRARAGALDRRILAALVVVALSTLLVRLGVTVRELIAAGEFGVGDTMDAFFIAYMVPAFVIGVVGASFSAAFVPAYIEARERHGHEAAARLLANVAAASVALLAAIALTVAIVFPIALPALAAEFDADKRSLTLGLFLVMLPSVVLSGVSTLWAASLNAVDRFALAAVAPALGPIFAVAFLLSRGDEWGAYALAAGVAVGAVAEAVVLWLVGRRHGVAVRPRWRGLDQRTRAVLRHYVPAAAGAFVMGATVLVDQAMAAALAAGSVSELNYGQRIVTFFLGVGGLAIATAVLPYFSRMVAAGDRAALGRTLRGYLTLILFGGTLLVVVFWTLSEPLVALLFEHGSFTAEDTEEVAYVQRLFALQIPFYLGGILLVRLASSLGANVILLWASLVNLTVNVVLNLIFIRLWGVAGIALSTSVVYLVSFSFLIVALRRRMRVLADA